MKWKASDLENLKTNLKPNNVKAVNLPKIEKVSVFGTNQIILGNCPSKSNCYRIYGKRLVKSNKLKTYEISFAHQCDKYRDANIDQEFELNLKVFYPSRRSDLDNSLKVILDCLEKAGAITNDNKCMKITACKFIDKDNPRIEFFINKS